MCFTVQFPLHSSRSPMSSRRRHTGDREAPSPSACLGVFGLSLYTTERELEKEFSKFGPLEKITVVLDGKVCYSIVYTTRTFNDDNIYRILKLLVISIFILIHIKACNIYKGCFQFILSLLFFRFRLVGPVDSPSSTTSILKMPRRPKTS